jgi:hypothetical protein
MNNVRADVAAILKATTPPPAQEPEPQLPPSTEEFKVGDLVGIKPGATYYTGKAIPSWVLAKKWYIKSIKGDRAVIDKSADGKESICSPVNTKFLTVVKSNNSSASESAALSPYLVKVNVDSLNIRKGAGTNYGIIGSIEDKGVYTIVDEATGNGATKWGLLKSYKNNRNGWISLDFCEKFNK